MCAHKLVGLVVMHKLIDITFTKVGISFDVMFWQQPQKHTDFPSMGYVTVVVKIKHLPKKKTQQIQRKSSLCDDSNKRKEKIRSGVKPTYNILYTFVRNKLVNLAVERFRCRWAYENVIIIYCYYGND